MGDHQGWPRPAKMSFPSGDVPRSITRLQACRAIVFDQGKDAQGHTSFADPEQ